MPDLLTPVGPPYYIGLPNDWMAWLGWVVLLGVLGWGVFHFREQNRPWGKKEWAYLGALVLATLVTSLFVGVRLSPGAALPPPGRPEEPRGPVLMFLAALPWMLSGGFLGILPAVGLGLLSGLIAGFTDTHTLFTPLEIGALALLFTLAIRQRYRTLVFQILRYPLISAGLVGLLYAPLFLACIAFEIPEASLVVRFDYALTHLPASTLAVGGEMILGGALAQIVSIIFPYRWGRRDTLVASPAEISLELRFFYGIGPLVLLLLMSLMVGDWIVAGNAAQNMLRDRLSNTAEMAAESIPSFLESGQNLILKMSSDPQLLATPANQLPEYLHRELTSAPFFRQLYLVDKTGSPVGGYPEGEFNRLQTSAEEREGIQLALKGVSVQTYTTPPSSGGITAQVSFISAIKNAQGEIGGVLIGRSDLATNPFTKPVIEAFEKMEDQGETGIIVDESGRILYHPISSWLMSTYRGRTATVADFFDETASDGTRNLVYYEPTLGESWAIVLTIPAQRAQQIALNIAIPLLLMILFIAILVYVSLRLGLRVVSGSLLALAGEAGRIAQGQLDHSLAVRGVDEVGQLSQAFEHMRVGLKARLEELDRLLLVSQGVASSLEFEDAVQPILRALFTGDVCSARVVLAIGEDEETVPGESPRFGVGNPRRNYAYLDDQILQLCQTHEHLVLPNLTRGKGLNFQPGVEKPGAILAVPLHHETQYYGALWVAYDHPRTFSEEEVSFITTLAAEAGLAAANGRLFAKAEIGRQRLEAILASTPDPVLVTDEQGRLFLTNPAAMQIPGLLNGPVKGSPIDEVIDRKDLLDLLHAPGEEQPSRELTLSNGRVYYASVSSVAAGGQGVGKVCILRDITHFKEADSLKSDFVATVSHDLRSPLALMRGYATMLQMVGDLNDQQKGYVRKIITGVESMSRLVNNLLDLGRIETGVGLQVENVAVVDVIERVIGSLQMPAAQKSIQLKQVFPEDPVPVVEADQALLQQALYNLVENGIKYTPMGGEVVIQVQSRPESILFDVCDTGIGIAPLDQPRLFEKFYRSGQKEGSQQRGSGLGLAIVKSIAERHHGRIWLESYLGRGSTFHLEIPIHQDAQGDPIKEKHDLTYM